jgi:hypothetical protein
MEWPLGPNLAHYGSKQVDVPDEQIVWITFEQVDGEEIGSAGYTITSVVGHRDSSSEKPITQGTIADRGNIEFTMAFPIIASCGAIRGYTIAPYSLGLQGRREATHRATLDFSSFRVALSFSNRHNVKPDDSGGYSIYSPAILIPRRARRRSAPLSSAMLCHRICALMHSIQVIACNGFR